MVGVRNGGLGYSKIPGIDRVANLGVTTSKGYGAVLDPISLTIGRIESVDIQDIGSVSYTHLTLPTICCV